MDGWMDVHGNLRKNEETKAQNITKINLCGASLENCKACNITSEQTHCTSSPYILIRTGQTKLIRHEACLSDMHIHRNKHIHKSHQRVENTSDSFIALIMGPSSDTHTHATLHWLLCFCWWKLSSLVIWMMKQAPEAPLHPSCSSGWAHLPPSCLPIRLSASVTFCVLLMTS